MVPKFSVRITICFIQGGIIMEEKSKQKVPTRRNYYFGKNSKPRYAKKE